MSSVYRASLCRIQELFPVPYPEADNKPLAEQMLEVLRGAGEATAHDHARIGDRVPLDYRGARENARLPEQGIELAEATAELVSRCQGLINPTHPCTQRQVVPPVTFSSVVAGALSSLYNANIGWDEYSQRIALAEVEVVAMLAELIGYDPNECRGLSTFGGVGTNLYGAKVGLEKAVPNARREGITQGQRVVIIASEASHFGRMNVSSWLGIGSDNLVLIPCDERGKILTKVLDKRLRELVQGGVKIATILATIGTTDVFAMDDVAAIDAIRNAVVDDFNLPYRIHIHADAVAGWAWRVFSDYDFSDNPMQLPQQTLAVLQEAEAEIDGIHLADSVGVDFHKLGFAPYISSVVLFKRQKDIELLLYPQEQISCLFQYGKYRPGVFTLEGSRAGSGVLAGLINLKLFGKQGLRTIIAHLTEMTQLLRQQLQQLDFVEVLNSDSHGFVTLFRVCENSVNDDNLTRKIFEHLHEQEKGAMLSIVHSYRATADSDPCIALKIYLMSPFTDEQTISATVTKISKARKSISVGDEDSSCGLLFPNELLG